MERVNKNHSCFTTSRVSCQHHNFLASNVISVIGIVLKGIAFGVLGCMLVERGIQLATKF